MIFKNFVLFLLAATSVSATNGTDVNPESYGNYALNPDRKDFLGNPPPANDACGLTCRGPDMYSFGLFACIQTMYEDSEGNMPSVTIDEHGTIVLPKITFSPSTSYYDFSLYHYNIARQSFLGSRLPAAIMFAETDKDVINGINCARENGYKVSPRGRGHDHSGHGALEGTLVIDMQLNCKYDDFVTDHNAKGSNILPGSKYISTIRVPAGCSNAVLLAAAHNSHQKDEGAMTIIGTCPSVGVVGFFLNGGFGDQTPYTGLASDVVDEIEMVLYNGSLITASENENKDLFWASKGGTGGLGMITHFTIRVVQSPNPLAFTYLKLQYDNLDKDKSTARFMKFQKFLHENQESVLFGGGGGNESIQGIFLGSIEQAMSVLSSAGLLNNAYFTEDQSSSYAYLGGEKICDTKTSCNKIYQNFPKNGHAVQVETQGEVQAIRTCLSYFAWESFQASDLVATARSFNICKDLKLDDAYCVTITPTLPFNFILEESCYNPEVIDAILGVAKIPKSFFNRKGPSTESRMFLEQADLYPNVLAFGLTGESVAMGTAGLMLPLLERETVHSLLKSGHSIIANHFVHGAPMLVDPDSSGYPHRNTALNLRLSSESPEFVNLLLRDPAFQNDPINLQIYGNYMPSMRIPDYETHVYADHAERLSTIRTRHDILGGFDSPRYVSRKRNQARTVSLKPQSSKQKKAKKTAKTSN
eukprot:CAMPEP_0194292842 /NCGR_PEP_ID=MMETSP0169-20130528/46586_1 /TAXON_ID=218684 /ORGANISM="Corethron pennatum, Strain L29A3" /LENGTH=700 /DNA_ID=CAMNT_0039041167 /DNA_START=102 /DNA_END=2204 /DNA_ORIENTATION=-